MIVVLVSPALIMQSCWTEGTRIKYGREMNEIKGSNRKDRKSWSDWQDISIHNRCTRMSEISDDAPSSKSGSGSESEDNNTGSRSLASSTTNGSNGSCNLTWQCSNKHSRVLVYTPPMLQLHEYIFWNPSCRRGLTCTAKCLRNYNLNSMARHTYVGGDPSNRKLMEQTIGNMPTMQVCIAFPPKFPALLHLASRYFKCIIT